MKKTDVDAFRECQELFVLVDTKDMNGWLDIHLAFGDKASGCQQQGPLGSVHSQDKLAEDAVLVSIQGAVAKFESWAKRSLAKFSKDECRILLHLGQNKLGTDWLHGRHPAGKKLGLCWCQAGCGPTTWLM